MVELLVVLIGYIVVFEVESSHDKVLSEMGQTTKQGKKWHNLDTVLNIVLGLIVAYLYSGIRLEGIFILLYIASLRITYFPIRLNMKRKKPYFYLSKTNGWDKHFIGNKKLYFTVAFLLLFGSATLLIRTVLLN